MTEQTDLRRDRVEIALDRGTRAMRLLTWTAMFALVCLMLWVVSGMAANAEDPKAAARAIGNAGNAAARTIARDSSNAADVPGYAGTNLPERNIGASRLQDEGRARLADPDDPGGAAGRAVIRGTTQRPQRPVAAGDPVVVRSERVAASPQSSAHGADGLASGRTTACGADLQDAGNGGSCGSVRWCVGADCETVRPRAIEHRLRRGHDAAQHGAGARRRRVRPQQPALLHRPAPGLPHQAVRARQLLQEQWASRGPRQLLGLGAGAGGGAPRRQHPLSRPLLLEAHLLRRLHPPLARLVRVRLQARAHPAAAGPAPARHRLGKLPGLHRGRDRGHRLRPPRPVGVHPGPDGRLPRARGVAARTPATPARRCAPASGTFTGGAGEMATAANLSVRRTLARVLAAIGVWAALGASAAGGEWRSWCADEGAGASLGWHFYCDRQEEEPQRVEPAPAPPPGQTDRSATERIEAMRKALEEARAEAILDPTPENVTAYLRLQQETLQRAAVFSDAFRRTVWATPELDYTLQAPGRRARETGLVGPAPRGPRRRPRPPRRALRADLSRPCRLRGLQGVRAALARLREAPRPRRACRLAYRRGAGGLARGGRRSTGARPGSASATPPSRRWCCSTPPQSGCCRSGSASWPRTRWPSGSTR